MTDGILHPIEPGPNAVSHALAHVRAFCDATRPPCAVTLAIVVEEVVANLVEHGGARAIALGLAREGDDVRVVVEDDGRAFDPRDAAAPGDRPPERGGGAGLALVRAWGSMIDYAQEGERNRLTLRLPPG